MPLIDGAGRPRFLSEHNSTYTQRAAAQLKLWLDGWPVHNDIDNECVPDFSCCEGQHYLAKERLRRKFVDDPNSRRAMLIFFADCVGANNERFPVECDLSPIGGDIRGKLKL